MLHWEVFSSIRKGKLISNATVCTIFQLASQIIEYRQLSNKNKIETK